MRKVYNEVDTILDTQAKANSADLHNAIIIPFSVDYPFSTNGVYFYVGKMGSGKTYNVIKHVMVTDRLMKKPYYDQIVISAISGSMDNTAKIFMKNCKTPITTVNDVQLMQWLKLTSLSIPSLVYALYTSREPSGDASSPYD